MQPLANFSPVKQRLLGWAKRSRQRLLSEKAADDESAGPLLKAALKPFGKNGVRLGWQVEPSLVESGENVYIEYSPLGNNKWLRHSDINHAGQPGGITVIKQLEGGSAPSQMSWRIRSSGGAISEVATLGGGVKRGATGIWKKGAAPPKAPPSRVSAAAELPTGAGSSSGAARRSSEAQSAEEINSECRFLWQMVAERQGEVEILLRAELTSQENVSLARESVLKALAFDDTLTSYAEAAGKVRARTAVRAPQCTHRMPPPAALDLPLLVALAPLLLSRLSLCCVSTLPPRALFFSLFLRARRAKATSSRCCWRRCASTVRRTHSSTTLQRTSLQAPWQRARSTR